MPGPNWPPSPVLNQTHSEGGVTWIHNSVAWEPLPGTGELFYWPISLSPLDTLITVGIGAEFCVDRGFVLTQVPSFTVFDAPEGASLQMEVTKNTNTIYLTGQKPEIQTTLTSSGSGTKPGVFLLSAPSFTFAAGDFIVVSVLQIGSSYAGRDLVMWLTGRLL